MLTAQYPIVYGESMSIILSLFLQSLPIFKPYEVQGGEGGGLGEAVWAKVQHLSFSAFFFDQSPLPLLGLENNFVHTRETVLDVLLDYSTVLFHGW